MARQTFEILTSSVFIGSTTPRKSDLQYVNQLSYLSDWKNYSLDFSELTYQRVKALTDVSDFTIAIGNTATAFKLRWG